MTDLEGLLKWLTKGGPEERKWEARIENLYFENLWQSRLDSVDVIYNKIKELVIRIVINFAWCMNEEKDNLYHSLSQSKSQDYLCPLVKGSYTITYACLTTNWQ